MTKQDELLTPREAAEILKCSEAKLARHRSDGTGLPYVKLDRLVRYRRSDLEATIMVNTIVPTNQP